MAMLFLTILFLLPHIVHSTFEDAFEQVESLQRRLTDPKNRNNNNINSDDTPRDLQQSVGQTCQSLLASPPFPGCTCGVDDGSQNGALLTCNDFCSICRDTDDFCVTFSFQARYTAGSTGSYFPSFLQFKEVQKGTDSSNSVIVREQSLDADFSVTGCDTYINDRKCTSCLASCAEGAIHDCRNVAGINSIVNGCSMSELESLPLNSPFSSLNPAVSNMKNCVVDQNPPKKEKPEKSKEDSKMYGNDADRGGLKRKLTPRGSS